MTKDELRAQILELEQRFTQLSERVSALERPRILTPVNPNAPPKAPRTDAR
jgi:hypothetical protein